MDINDTLKKYSHLFAETYEALSNYFNRMENFEQFAVEIEIYVKPGELHLTYIRTENLIRDFEKELKQLGYYSSILKSGNAIVGLAVSKYALLSDILGESLPPNENVIIRGLLFGYSPKEIKDYMGRTGETQM